MPGPQPRFEQTKNENKASFNHRESKVVLGGNGYDENLIHVTFEMLSGQVH